jgi:hypothetical protein
MWFGKTAADVPDEPADLSLTVDKYLRTRRQKVHNETWVRIYRLPQHYIPGDSIVKATWGDRKLRGAWSLSDETIGRT